MKNIIAVLLMLVSFSAGADEFNFEWRDQDTARAMVLIFGHAIDANQTKKIMYSETACQTLIPNVSYHNPNIEAKWAVQSSGGMYAAECIPGLREMNSRIGQRASNAKINAYFIGLSLIEIAAAKLLPQDYYLRDIFQYVRIEQTREVIKHNEKNHLGLSVGLKIGF